MQIIEAKERQVWNSFVLSGAHSPFTQSWEWGELQENLGRKIWRLELRENIEMIGVAQIIKYPLPFGNNFLYIPRGPIINKNYQQNAGEEFIKYLKNLTLKEKAIFVRMDFNLGKGLKVAPKEAYRSAITQPKSEWMIDLSLSESDLLSKMHEKTRYNIRLAQKKAVAVKIYFDNDLEKKLENLFNLLKETALRDKFYLHPIAHYQKIIDIFGNNIELAVAEYEGKILAAGLVLFFGNTATYLYGGSSSENRNLMAPYAMHWQAIRRAKEKGLVSPKLSEGGCQWYSFGAVNDSDLATVTRFKQGFGGELIDFGGSFDMINNPLWYFLYNTARKFKK